MSLESSILPDFHRMRLHYQNGFKLVGKAVSYEGTLAVGILQLTITAVMDTD